jgi:hypothetical protein
LIASDRGILAASPELAAGMPPLLARWEACRHNAEEVARRLPELKW